jgi:hypothetical protein
MACNEISELGERASVVQLARPRLRERVQAPLQARLRAAALDRELARGVPSDSTAALAVRARILARPPTRRELGQQLRRIVREAHDPRPPGNRIAPVASRVLEAEDDLRLLASRLDSPLPVAVRGVASVRALLSDGSGPLYHRGSAEDLGAAARRMAATL